MDTSACRFMPQALEHREAALKLAQHWKEEAIKQARFAQVSNRPACFEPASSLAAPL